MSKAPLKIWHIAEFYPPTYGGGAAIYLQDICRYLTDLGNENRILCINLDKVEPYKIETDFDGTIQLDRVHIPFRERDPSGFHLSHHQWSEHKQKIEVIAENILKDWQPDIIQFHTPYSLIEECLPNILKRNLPIVGMLHCAWLICPRLDLIKSPTGEQCSGPSTAKCLHCLYSHWDGSNAKSLIKLPWRIAKLGTIPYSRLQERKNLRKFVNGLVGPSKFMTDVHQGFIDGEVKHIPLGIDLTDLPTEVPDRPRNPLRFGFIGGFQDIKGIWDVLDTVKILKNKGYKFELHVWGPKQDKQKLIERDIEDFVILHGMFKPEDKWKVYAEMDILLMATQRAEPFGRVIQEAAAMKVPTIAPNTGGITEQIDHNINGFLYKFLNRQSLEDYMTKFIENPDLVKEFSARLWKVVDTREAVKDLDKFYRDVAEKFAER